MTSNKIGALVCAALLVLGLAACGSSKKSSTGAAGTGTASGTIPVSPVWTLFPNWIFSAIVISTGSMQYPPYVFSFL